MRVSSIKTHILRFLNKNNINKTVNILDNIKLLQNSKYKNKNISTSLFNHLQNSYLSTNIDIIQEFNSHPKGLTEKQANEILDKIGYNDFVKNKKKSKLVHLWQCYTNPFNILLSILAMVSFFTQDITSTILILTMVFSSTLIRFFQENKSNKETDKLKSMVSNTSTVLRREEDTDDNYLEIKNIITLERKKEVPIAEIVPGDIILLSSGDLIPADLRILNAKDLFISQAIITGESEPVEKFSYIIDHNAKNYLEFSNIAYMGTTVVSGSATAMVISTGNNTYFGNFAQSIISLEKTQDSFQISINKISWLLIKFMLIMAPVILFINGFIKGDWSSATLFALSIAVGLTPEMLPMIITSTLAKGAIRLSRKKVIVKNLDSIYNFGAMNVLCTDKTGTLTQDKIFLEKHTDALGNISNEVLQYAYINSYYQTGLKNLLDIAVLEKVEINKEINITKFDKIDEIPFDFKRRRMSVIVNYAKDHNQLICKGALEEILSVCKYVKLENRIVNLSDDLLKEIIYITSQLNIDGLRVVAVATKEFDNDKIIYSINDENELTLQGYIAFLDPPKETTEPALKALKNSGIEVKILTGDNSLVTKKICKEVNFHISGIMIGEDIDKLDDIQLQDIVRKNNVFAKLDPHHKERIIQVLKNSGNTVGFLGDGINDALALKTADIGISVDSAVDIAKEAADIILLEKSLMVLEKGVMEGRKTFINMLKYIKSTTSSNFGNVFSVLIASFFLPFLPMLPIHILMQNLLYDLSQTAIPFDNVDQEDIKTPKKINAQNITTFMLFFGPISSIFDLLTYLAMWFIFAANTISQQAIFQTGWFLEGLVSQILIVHLIRTKKIPFVNSKPSWALLLMGSVTIIIGISMSSSMLSKFFKMETLPYTYYIMLIILVISYILLFQLVKTIYIKKYNWL
jgi:P-type Mg2+ transporter